jgi:serine/threonine protein kinase
MAAPSVSAPSVSVPSVSVPTLTLPPNETRKNPLIVQVEKMIGSGGLGQVYKIKYNGQDAALKIVENINPETKDIINEEVRMLKSISKRYPDCALNILCYFDISQDDEYVYFVSELLDFDYFDVLVKDKYCDSENGEKINYVYESLKQMLNGLRTLHMVGILHRDIKPENFLVKSSKPEVIKIADFGFSCYYLDQNKENTCKGRLGTPGYIPPHIYLDEKEPVWTVMDDLYSLACVVYAALTCESFMDNDAIIEMKDDYYEGKISKKEVENFYFNNYKKKITKLHQIYQTQPLTESGEKGYKFLWDVCSLLDPRNQVIVSANDLLTRMEIIKSKFY